MDTTQPTTTCSNLQEQCRLFKLPAEIRNHIYSLVLTVPPRLEAGRVRLTNAPTHPDRPTVLTMLQTCRLVNYEAQGMFYDINHLQLRGYPILFGFFRQVNRTRLSAIRTFTIITGNFELVTGIFKVLYRLEGLQSISIIVSHAFRDFYNGECILEDLRRESPFIKSAIRRLPKCLEDIKINVHQAPQKYPQPLIPDQVRHAVVKLESDVMRKIAEKCTGKSLAGVHLPCGK